MARAFAREGARIFLIGRTLATLDRVAEGIRSAGGAAETARADAIDEQAVEKHIGEVVEQAGSVDVSFNAISIRNVQLIPLVEMSREDFVSSIVTATTTHLLTARAAARRMTERGSGVILKLSASAVCAYVPGVYMGGFGVACAAIEALTKQFAAELGPDGIRTICCLRLEGIPESWEGVLTEDWSAPTTEIEAQMKARSLLAGSGDDADRRGQRGDLSGLGSSWRDDRDRLQLDQRHGRRLVSVSGNHSGEER